MQIAFRQLTYSFGTFRHRFTDRLTDLFCPAHTETYSCSTYCYTNDNTYNGRTKEICQWCIYCHAPAIGSFYGCISLYCDGSAFHISAISGYSGHHLLLYLCNSPQSSVCLGQFNVALLLLGNRRITVRNGDTSFSQQIALRILTDRDCRSNII